MNGGSPRRPGTGLDSGNNARGSLVKDFLLSTSRRLSASALHLSVFTGSGTRSEENIPLTSNRETAFSENVSAPTTFLPKQIDNAGRLRTSSLTMDANCNHGKDIDSGNSSLIDSSSADSYQEFGAGTRSRTTSSSKSDQSLASDNQGEFQTSCHRNKRYLSDSISGSSGKVSLNNSDVIERSDESLTSDKNTIDNIRSSSVYINEDTHCESESQPFLYFLSDACSFSSFDGDSRYGPDLTLPRAASLDSCESDNCEYPDDDDKENCNSTTTRESLKSSPSSGMRSGYLNKKGNSSFIKYSLYEGEPLLSEHSSLMGKGQNIINDFNPEGSKPPIRRSASLNNISQTSLNNTTIMSSKPHKLESELYQVKNSTTNSGKLAAKNISDKRQQRHDVRPLHLFTDQPSSSPSAETNGSAVSTSYHPQQNIGQSHVLHSPSKSHEPETPHQQLQQTQSGYHSQVCSDNDCLCKPAYIFANQPANFKNTDNPLITISQNNPQYVASNEQHEQCFSKNPVTTTDGMEGANSTAKTPTQNLESVLGYGTPVSASVLKRGRKKTQSNSEKPLQVFVPRAKLGSHVINRMFVSKNVSLPVTRRQDKTTCSSDLLLLPNNAEVEPTASIFHNCLSSVVQAMSDLPSESQSKQNLPYSSLQNYSVYSTAAPTDSNQDTILAEDIIGDPYNHKPIINSDRSQSVIQKGHAQINNTNTTNILMEPQCTVDRKSEAEHVETELHPQTNYLYNRQERCESEPTPIQNAATTGETKANDDFSWKTPKRRSSVGNIDLLTNVKTETEYGHDVSQAAMVSPAAQNSDLNQEGTIPNHTSHNSRNGHPYTGCQIQGQDPVVNGNTQNAGSERDHADADDNGYTSGMMLRIPRACFVVDMSDSHENCDDSRATLRHSGNSSTDSGHPDTNDGSLPHSNTSQLGLLKVNKEIPRQHDYFNREIPDYKYLCIVASIFNPLFGLVALICNFYARRYLRLRRPAQANNFYFATIVISTVAIFLTLIAGALFFAHVIVLKSDKGESTPVPLLESCEGKLFGTDTYLQSFFDVDFELYCEVIKNEKIMEALKRYYVEHTYNKEVHSNRKVASSGILSLFPGTAVDVTATKVDNQETEAGDPEVVGVDSLNTTHDTEDGNSISKKMFDLETERNNSSEIRLKNSSTEHISINSSTGSIINPEDTEEVTEAAYTKQQQITEIDTDKSRGVAPVKTLDISEAPPRKEALRSTTVSTVDGFAGNSTKEFVAGLLEVSEMGISNATQKT